MICSACETARRRVGLGLFDEGVTVDLVGDRVTELIASPRAAPAAVEPYSPASPMEIGCRAAKRSPRLQTCQPTHSAFQAVVHREHPNAIGAPHEVRGMSDDLTVMGIAATAAAAMGREQIVLAHQAEHPLAGNPDVATDPKPSPDLAVALALPGRCLQVGFDRHQQRLVRDRGLRSNRRFDRRLLGVLAGGNFVDSCIWPCPRRRRPAAGRRPDPCRARWRHSSPRPPPPQRADSVLASSSSTSGQLSDPLHGAIQFRLHSRRSLSHTTNWRDRSCTGSSRKSRRTTSRLRATVHRWPSPSGPAGKAWPGENVDERPHLPQAHQQQLSSQNYRSCSGPPWTLRLSQFCVQGNRVRLNHCHRNHRNRRNCHRNRHRNLS